MYTYRESIPKSFSEVLDSYSQEAIFKMVFNEYPDYGKNYCSPFRIDNNPKCFFEWYKERLFFKDFADVQRDCFSAVKDYFNLNSYKEVFEKIHDYFQGKPLDKPQFKQSVVKSPEKDFYNILISRRSFEKADKLFWSQYHITEQQLNEDSVYPICTYRFYARKQRRWIIINPYDIAYAIVIGKYKKIYRPKQKGINKWMTNCSNNQIGNLQNISKKENYLIITKSYKDHRVIKNENFLNTVWFQSENQIPDNDILLDLINGFYKVIIFYDNDDAGIRGSSNLKERIKFVSPNTDVTELSSPFRIFKDPASIVSNKSRTELQSLLWESMSN